MKHIKLTAALEVESFMLVRTDIIDIVIPHPTEKKCIIIVNLLGNKGDVKEYVVTETLEEIELLINQNQLENA